MMNWMIWDEGQQKYVFPEQEIKRLKMERENRERCITGSMHAMSLATNGDVYRWRKEIDAFDARIRQLEGIAGPNNTNPQGIEHHSPGRVAYDAYRESLAEFKQVDVDDYRRFSELPEEQQDAWESGVRAAMNAWRPNDVR